MGDGDAMGGGGAGAGAGPEGTGLETVREAPSRGRCPLPGAPAAPPEPRPPRRASSPGTVWKVEPGDPLAAVGLHAYLKVDAAPQE